MLQIRLSDKDRERLGCPEWITYDPDRLSLIEAEILDEVGIDWATARHGDPLTHANGRPVLLASGGQARRYRPKVQRVWIWLALRHAGVDVPFAEFDIDLGGLAYGAEPVESPGKDPASETSDAVTPSPSPVSGAGRRKSRASSASTSG